MLRRKRDIKGVFPKKCRTKIFGGIKMAKRRLKKGRVAFAMFVVAGTIVFADNVRRDLFPPKQSGIIVSGSFKSDNAQNSPQ